MVYLARCDSHFSLNDLAAQIRKSSNFRFVWQFYQCSGVDPQAPATIRQALEAIIATPELHAFLRESFEPMSDEAFKVKPLHEHCRVDAVAGEFENILARAASDHLGAYSQQLRDATADEKQSIKELFERMGEYRAYALRSAAVKGEKMQRVGPGEVKRERSFKLGPTKKPKAIDFTMLDGRWLRYP